MSVRRIAFAPDLASRRRSAWIATFAVVAGLGLATAPSAPAVLIGAVDDPAGDAADPAPARDIRGAGLAYDRRRGGLVGAFTLGGAPTRDTAGLMTIFAGMRTAEGCNGYPAVGFSTYTDGNYPRWHLFEQAGGAGVFGDTRKTGSQTAVQRFEVVDKRLAGKKPDCVIATLTAPGDASVVYDTTGPIPIKAEPVTQVQLRNVPKRLQVGRTRQVRVTVTNAGDAPTRPVRLRVASARGLRTSLGSSRLKAIAPGKSRTVTLRVSLTSRAKSRTTLKLTATAGAQKVSATGEIARQQPRRSGGSGNGSGGNRPPMTCNRWIPDFSGESGGYLGLVPC